MDVVEVAQGVSEVLVIGSVPMAFFGEDVFIFGVAAVEIVIAKTDEDRCNFAESSKPSAKATEFGGGVDGIERINQITGDNDVVWFLLRGMLGDGVEAPAVHFGAEVDVAN